MSSILDALRKLEDEQRQITEMREIEPHEAAHELVSARTPRPISSPQSLSPQTLYLTLGAFAVGAVCVSVVVTTMLLRDSGGSAAAEPAPVQTAAVEAPAMQAPSVQSAAVPVTVPSPAEPAPMIQPPTTPSPALSATADEEPEAKVEEPSPTRKPVELERQDPVGQPVQTASVKPAAPRPEPAPEPEPARPKPASEPVRPQTPAASVDVPARTVEPESTPLPSYEEVQKRLAKARESLSEPSERAWDTPPMVDAAPLPEPKKPVSPANLPILSPAAKSRHGLDGLMVNMLSPASPTKPQASAIISNMKYFVGERINNTRAKLVQVEPDGVVLEISGTGEQYFLAQ